MKKLLLKLIKLYWNVSNTFFKDHKGKCKFTPSCSRYAYDAITKYGAFKGTYLAVWRILRCNPFSKGGYDPVK
ncbi:MAG: membrane protein insertion efficiency factor YidD [Clostridia bacterium]|nr:membrane protein insertion efficiency factor YidD [Clostridia bacterium]